MALATVSSSSQTNSVVKKCDSAPNISFMLARERELFSIQTMNVRVIHVNEEIDSTIHHDADINEALNENSQMSFYEIPSSQWLTGLLPNEENNKSQ
ncbi:hypothetical protein FDP41_005661 [Naegleria fowleri]|uniref:Uncharacterized protein n=1 Tax=Naegleria fowleri TaxID=5763 RepID=A0A6A5BMW9_NAEFO|nr:uncharacterized protein FDP41_005661 [Naegleria fowleri]KAF0975330.1 hypothetical protein FDP41_005661 [Naegleria fowleri]